MDGFQQRNTVQPEIDTCKSYSSEIETINGAHNNTLQSPCCEPNEEEPTPYTERSDFLVSGAKKDSDVPTDCYDFMGLSAVEKKNEVSTTETRGGQFFA